MKKLNPFKKGGMFEGASPLIFQRAASLRGNMTDAEAYLWTLLKKGVCGFKFRRQHPIGFYIADFYCHKAKLVIELDGRIHEDPMVIENDRRRQKNIEDWGYKVIRFSNEEVMKKMEYVLKAIASEMMVIIANIKYSTDNIE